MADASFEAGYAAAQAVFADRRKVAEAQALFEALCATVAPAERASSAAYARALLMVGRCQALLGLHEQALQTLGTCVSNALVANGARSLAHADALLALADAHRRCSKHRDALALAEKAQTIIAHLMGADSHDHARALLVVGTVMIDQGQSRAALGVLERAQQHMRPDTEEHWELLYELSNAWEELGDYDRAIELRPAFLI